MDKKLESRGARGLAPISGTEAAFIHNQALERAALLLENTAQELSAAAVEWAEREPRVRDHNARNFNRTQKALYEGKAALLRGQAAHIRELKVEE